MALLLLLLFIGTLIILFYYELRWKSFEREKEKNLVVMAKEFLFSNIVKIDEEAQNAAAGSDSSWGDWRYRMRAELYRREELRTEEAAKIVGVTVAQAEEYLDQLEEEGKVLQAGDAERGIFYRVVSDV